MIAKFPKKLIPLLCFISYFLMFYGCQASEDGIGANNGNVTGMELGTKDSPEEEEDTDILTIVETMISPLQVVDLSENGMIELKSQANEPKSHLIMIANPNELDVVIGTATPAEILDENNTELNLDTELSSCLVQELLQAGQSCSLVIHHQPELGTKSFQIKLLYSVAEQEKILDLNILSIGETPAILEVDNLPMNGYFEFSGPALEINELTVRLVNTGVADASEIYLTGIDDPDGQEMPLPFMINEAESSCLTQDSLPAGESCDLLLFKELTLSYNIDSFIVHYHNGAEETQFGIGIRSHGDAPAILEVSNLPAAGHFELSGVIGESVSETIVVRNTGSGPATQLGLSTIPDPDFNPRALPVDLDANSSCLKREALYPNETCEFNISKTLNRGINIDHLIVDYFNGISDDELVMGIHIIGETPAQLELVNPPSGGYRLASGVGETAMLDIEIQNVGTAPASQLTPMGILDPDGMVMDVPVTIEPTSTCHSELILDPNESCVYVVSNTPERAPYISIDTMRVRYQAGGGEEAYLSIGLRISGIE